MQFGLFGGARTKRGVGLEDSQGYESFIDYVIEAILQVYERRESISGYRITSQPNFLRHFSARFEPLGKNSVSISASSR